MHSHFRENLQTLCSTEKSVSHLCRALNINRQQFSRYLSGTTLPSARNTRLICQHFQISPRDLELDPEAFEMLTVVADRLQDNKQSPRRQDLSDAFEGREQELRRYLGYYHCYYMSPSWPNRLCCYISRWFQEGGSFFTKVVERNHIEFQSFAVTNKYVGQITMLGPQIHVIEYEYLSKDCMFQSILRKPARGRLNFLTGLATGVSSNNHIPYATKTIFKHLGRDIDLRSALNKTGAYDKDSRDLDPFVRSFMDEKPFFFE